MKVYIQSNSYQRLAAKVAAYSFKKQGVIDVNIIDIDDYPILKKQIGKIYLRNGKKTVYKNDLQSFTLLRFFPPKLNSYKGKLLIVDPDVFSVKSPMSIMNFLNNDNNKFLVCTSYNENFRSEVMLVDADKIRWDYEKILFDLFNLKIDYSDLINLKFIDSNLIQTAPSIYNQHDNIIDKTIILHTTNRITQPWKEGLSIDFEFYANWYSVLKNLIKRLIGREYSKKILSKYYLSHPNTQVNHFVLELFKESFKEGVFNKEEIIDAVNKKFISKIFYQKLETL